MLQSSQVKQLCKMQVTTQTAVMKIHGNDMACSAVTGDTFLDATCTEKKHSKKPNVLQNHEDCF